VDRLKCADTLVDGLRFIDSVDGWIVRMRTEKYTPVPTPRPDRKEN
jgi:hypothetical protein